jgi:hypothetical protein
MSFGKYRWKIRFDTAFRPDITVAARMDSINTNIYDYYILPSLEFGMEYIKLTKNNADLIDSFRFDNLDFLISHSMNIPIDEVNKNGK